VDYHEQAAAALQLVSLSGHSLLLLRLLLLLGLRLLTG
jgi:hypothetical protein